LVVAFPSGTIPDGIALVIQMFALVACLRAAEAPNRMIRVLEIFAVAAAVAGLVPIFWGDDVQKELVRLATFLLIFTSLPSIAVGLVRQLRRDKSITIRTVFGALCIYMLLIITFASAFGVVSMVEDAAFFAQGESANQYGYFVYFAVTTITTLGIGDYTPATDFGRALTGVLALIGQIYLVTVVALIVGNLGRRAPKRKDSDAGPGSG
jgi:Ca2+/Na+ antiporter